MPPIHQKFTLALCAGFVALFPIAAQEAKEQQQTPPAVTKPIEKKGQPLLLKKQKGTKFVRVSRDPNGKAKALQTAVVRYVPAMGNKELIIDLVSVVHIGDRRYYSQLNRQFEKYDAVLYELVAPPESRIPQDRKGGGDNPIAFLQNAMRTVLGLDSQLDCVDYTVTNFVHADLSPAEMAKAIEKRGDNMFTIGLSVAAEILRQQNLAEMKAKQQKGNDALEDFDPFSMLLDPTGPAKLKTMLAEQLSDMSDGTGLGQKLNTILIDDRNTACMKVLQKQVIGGKKRIAIFYGAAHMPDFDARLRELGMRQESLEWMDAWDLRPRAINLLDLIDRFGR